MWIDRRALPKTPNMDEDIEHDSRNVELLQYDVDSDEDMEIYHTDPYDTWNLRYRINYTLPQAANSAEAQRQRMLEAQRRGLAGGQGMALPLTAEAAQQLKSRTTAAAS